jgi:outer membrane biosynthesis protein TonB
MATQPHKALRIGVIQGGRIVEERVVRSRVPVTIGTSARNTIVVPQSNLPESFTLFALHGDQYFLSFDEGMQGRVQGDLGTAEFGALVAQGVARRQGSRYVIPLQEDQHGKVLLGEVTLLWQFVVPPLEPPRPVLPETARGNRFRSMDRLFVAVLTLSLALHISAYVALASTPAREDVTLEEIPDRFAKLLIPERKPEPPKRPEKKAEPVPEAKKEEKKEEKKASESDAAKAAGKAARAAQVQKAVQSKGILRVLGALGPGSGGGAVADVFGAGGGFGDVASALSGAGGVAVATDPGMGGGRKGGGQGGSARIGDLATGGGGGRKVGYGQKSEARVSGSVAAEEGEIDSADIDQAKLGAFIRARLAAIKACYENQLKRNPNLKGKIRVRFVVLATGGLTDLSIVENSLGSAETASCIIGTMRAWRTPFRPSGTVTVEHSFVFNPA